MNNLFSELPAYKQSFTIFYNSKFYTIIFDNGDIYETTKGFDSIFIMNVAKLFYPTNTDSKNRMFAETVTKHFITILRQDNDFVGIEITDIERLPIGIFTFINSKL